MTANLVSIEMRRGHLRGRVTAVVPQDLVITLSSEARPPSSYEGGNVALQDQLCITSCCA